MTSLKSFLSIFIGLTLQGGVIAHAQQTSTEQVTEPVAVPITGNSDAASDTRIDDLKKKTSMAKRANKIRKGDAAAIASTAVTAITGDSTEGQALNEDIKKANTMRKIASGNVGSLAKVLMKANNKDTPTGPSLRKLKKRAAQTTGLKSRNLVISEVKAGNPRTVYKATSEKGQSYWCFVNFDGKKTSGATCSENGKVVCNPTRKKAGEC